MKMAVFKNPILQPIVLSSIFSIHTFFCIWYVIHCSFTVLSGYFTSVDLAAIFLCLNLSKVRDTVPCTVENFVSRCSLVLPYFTILYLNIKQDKQRWDICRVTLKNLHHERILGS